METVETVSFSLVIAVMTIRVPICETANDLVKITVITSLEAQNDYDLTDVLEVVISSVLSLAIGEIHLISMVRKEQTIYETIEVVPMAEEEQLHSAIILLVEIEKNSLFEQEISMV